MRIDEVDKHKVFADEGKIICRKEDKVEFGKGMYLGKIRYEQIGCNIDGEEVIEYIYEDDTIDNYEEIPENI